MIEIGLGSVQSWECDAMGRLAVQHHVARAGDSVGALAIPLGLGPRQRRALDAELVATGHHIRFLRELRPGTPFTFLGGVLGVAEERLRLYQEMRDTLTGEIAATFVTEAVLIDAELRGRLPLPDDVRDRARALQVTLPEPAAARRLALQAPRRRPSWDEADRLGLALTQQGGVAAGECDGRGFLLTSAVISRIADGVPHLVTRMQSIDRAAEGIGGAALEYRLAYHATPREGDVLALRSGIKSVGAKTTIWGHWLFDRETGEAVATAEAVIAAFDLAQRKATAIPAALRTKLERQLVPDLSI